MDLRHGRLMGGLEQDRLEVADDWKITMELKIRWIGVLKIWRLRIEVAIDYEDIL
jgi:hypothetical protein